MNKYNLPLHLRGSDFDLYNRQHPASVLDLFQEAASCHAFLLGCDFEKMISKNLLWMVSRVRYTVIEDTLPHRPVSICTWPLAPARVIFAREYKICDGDKPLIIGSSEWATVDCNTRRLASAEGIYPDLDFCTDRNYGSRLPRLHDFEVEGEGYAVTPAFCDIDTNGHVNNTKYANYVMNTIALDSDKRIKEFQIDYHKEVQCSQPITIYTKENDNTIMAKGVDLNGDKMFLCEIVLK